MDDVMIGKKNVGCGGSERVDEGVVVRGGRGEEGFSTSRFTNCRPSILSSLSSFCREEEKKNNDELGTDINNAFAPSAAAPAARWSIPTSSRRMT
jgi:hypothetical protein